MPDTRAIKPEDNKGGTFTAQLTTGEVTTAYVSPVPTEAPGIITAEPGTVKEEAIYFKSKDAGAGTISGLVRDYTNLNGGVGQQHENGEDWEVFQSAIYIKNIIDILLEGFLREQATVARVDADEFTVVGNVAIVYTAGRLLRFNNDNNEIMTVVSSSYSGGSGLTTIVVAGTIPDPMTIVEFGIQPKTAAYLSSEAIIDEDDFASDLATKAPSQQSTKVYVDHRGKVPQVGTVADAATVTPTAGAGGMYTVTAIAQAFTVAAPSGTPENGQKLILRIKDDGTGRAITWNAIYRAVGVSLPTTTVAGKTMYLGFIYNTAATKWDCVASSQEV